MNEIAREREIEKTVSQWLGYIDHFPEPKDDIERTRYHYLCIHQFDSKKTKILKNCLSLAVIPVCLICSGLNTIIKRKGQKAKKCDLVEFEIEDRKKLSCDAIGIPEELKDKYPDIEIYSQKKGKAVFLRGYLDKRVFDFWMALVKRYPFSFYMQATR